MENGIAKYMGKKISEIKPRKKWKNLFPNGRERYVLEKKLEEIKKYQPNNKEAIKLLKKRIEFYD